MREITCQHCGKEPAFRRGLGWRCYISPQIRDLYPKFSKRTVPRRPCIHCGNEEANRRRGLGPRCYSNLEIRQSYAVRTLTKKPDMGLCLEDIEPPPPADPTTIVPGPEKVAILAARAEMGTGLWHPGDMTYAGLALRRQHQEVNYESTDMDD